MDLSLTINAGEIVGLVGPNGAGKSTFLKMLSGILTPSSGEILVNNFIPYQRKKGYLNQIGMMMGNKSILHYDLPVRDSLQYYQAMYPKPSDEFILEFNELIRKIDVEKLLDTPVRKLSLGQRIKVELLASIIHLPKILFLDEPTIGVDYKTREEVLDFIQKFNEKYNITIIFTSHNLDDIERICTRLIFINNGLIEYDGNIDKIKDRDQYKTISIITDGNFDLVNLNFKYKLIEKNENRFLFLIRVDEVIKCFPLFNCPEIKDINISKPNLEYILYEADL